MSVILSNWTMKVHRLNLGYVHTYTFSNQHRFQKSPFSPVHTTTQRFRKSPFSKDSTFKPVFKSLRFRWKRRLSKTLNKRLHVDGRRKRTEKSPFSHENVYVWTWPQTTSSQHVEIYQIFFEQPLKLFASYAHFSTGESNRVLFSESNSVEMFRLRSFFELNEQWKKPNIYKNTWP